MSEIILRDAVVTDDWQMLRASADEAPTVGAGRVIVPLAMWLDQQSGLAARGDVAVWLAGTDDPVKLASIWWTGVELHEAQVFLV